jgi:hypothetical protein
MYALALFCAGSPLFLAADTGTHSNRYSQGLGKLALLSVSACQSPVFSERVAFRFRGHWEPMFRFPIYQNDAWRSVSWFTRTGFGVGTERYLGDGWAAGLDVEFGASLFEASIRLNWYPVEGVQLSAGVDFLRLGLVASVGFAP